MSKSLLNLRCACGGAWSGLVIDADVGWFIRWWLKYHGGSAAAGAGGVGGAGGRCTPSAELGGKALDVGEYVAAAESVERKGA